MTFAEFVVQREFIRKFIREHNTALGRHLKLVESITPYLKTGGKILDIGAGSCQITKILRDKGFDVTPVDIKNLSIMEDITPIIFDGRKLPFKKNSFDTTLLIAVLHHTVNPELILKEAKRVSKHIVIVEDIYTNSFHKYLTFIMDCIVNLEFFGHPHTNKNDRDWKKLFKRLKLSLKDSKYAKMWVAFLLGIYHLEK